KLITISSGAHNSGRKGAAHYCASKAGVVMFTKVLAMELGPHRINVNCIAPGLVTVERNVNEVSDEYVRTLVATIPWGRPGSPEDIAHAALFRSEEHTSELQSRFDLVCRLLLEKKKNAHWAAAGQARAKRTPTQPVATDEPCA